MRTRNHYVGYRSGSKHYRASLNTRTILAMLSAGVTFKYCDENGYIAWTSGESPSPEIKELLEQNLIWWGHTIDRDQVAQNRSYTDLAPGLPRDFEALVNSTRSPLKRALKTPSIYLSQRRMMGDLPEGIATILEMIGQTTQHDTASINQNENQENTDMSTPSYPAPQLTTKAVQTKAGWVGQVLHGQNIVWESSPVANDTDFGDTPMTPDVVALDLAVAAIAEFYRSAFDDVTVKGFEAKPKGKK
jgi:hypothetical protein